MQRLTRIAFVFAAVLSFVMAAIPHPPPLPGEPGDKVLHILAFTTLGILAAYGFRNRSLTMLFSALSTYGAAIELVQLIPALNRDSSWLDLLADMAAALIALWITRYAIARWNLP